MSIQQLEALACALEDQRYEIAKAVNSQDYGRTQWVSEIWTIKRRFDGVVRVLHLKGMADDAPATLPAEDAYLVEAFPPGGKQIADLWFGKNAPRSRWGEAIKEFVCTISANQR